MPVKSERCWIFWFGLRPSHSEIQFRKRRKSSLANRFTSWRAQLRSSACQLVEYHYLGDEGLDVSDVFLGRNLPRAR